MGVLSQNQMLEVFSWKVQGNAENFHGEQTLVKQNKSHEEDGFLHRMQSHSNIMKKMSTWSLSHTLFLSYKTMLLQ